MNTATSHGYFGSISADAVIRDGKNPGFTLTDEDDREIERLLGLRKPKITPEMARRREKQRLRREVKAELNGLMRSADDRKRTEKFQKWISELPYIPKQAGRRATEGGESVKRKDRYEIRRRFRVNGKEKFFYFGLCDTPEDAARYKRIMKLCTTIEIERRAGI